MICNAYIVFPYSLSLGTTLHPALPYVKPIGWLLSNCYLVARIGSAVSLAVTHSVTMVHAIVVRHILVSLATGASRISLVVDCDSTLNGGGSLIDCLCKHTLCGLDHLSHFFLSLYL